MADTTANDRYLKTPISFDDIMPKAMGEYRDNLPFLPGKITLDSQLYNDPQYLKDHYTNLGEKINIDPADILRHEIIHSAMDKYKVKNNQVNTPNDTSEGSSLNDLLKRTISKNYGSQEWLTHSLQSKKGDYMDNGNGSVLDKGNTQLYQRYLLHSLANSPNIHPKFKEILRRMGYGI